jgi:hypothetical protein
LPACSTSRFRPFILKRVNGAGKPVCPARAAAQDPLGPDTDRLACQQDRAAGAAKLLRVDSRGNRSGRSAFGLGRRGAAFRRCRTCFALSGGPWDGRRIIESEQEEEMTGTLDWKWIGIGIVVMIVLNLIAGFILGFFLAPQLEGATTPEEVQLSGGQIALIAILNFLAFAIGGFIVGLKSAGRTILEPGISAAIAVVIALLISGNFGIVNIIAGGLVPFIAGVLGGWLGERQQGTV